MKRIVLKLLVLSIVFVSPLISEFHAASLGQSTVQTAGGYYGELDKNHYNEIDKRLSVLESSKNDIGIWIKLFIAVVTILIGANIGLSVWQVGSIARREAQNIIQECDQKFHKLLSDKENYFDKKINTYENRISAIMDSMKDLEKKSEINIQIVSEKIIQIKLEIQTLLSAFRDEAEAMRTKSISDLEEWLSRHMQG